MLSSGASDYQMIDLVYPHYVANIFLRKFRWCIPFWRWLLWLYKCKDSKLKGSISISGIFESTLQRFIHLHLHVQINKFKNSYTFCDHFAYLFDSIIYYLDYGKLNSSFNLFCILLLFMLNYLLGQRTDVSFCSFCQVFS